MIFTITMLCISTTGPCLAQKWIEAPQEYPTLAICEAEFKYLPPPPGGTKWICSQGFSSPTRLQPRGGT